MIGQAISHSAKADLLAPILSGPPDLSAEAQA